MVSLFLVPINSAIDTPTSLKFKISTFFSAIVLLELLSVTNEDPSEFLTIL